MSVFLPPDPPRPEPPAPVRVPVPRRMPGQRWWIVAAGVVGIVVLTAGVFFVVDRVTRPAIHVPTPPAGNTPTADPRTAADRSLSADQCATLAAAKLAYTVLERNAQRFRLRGLDADAAVKYDGAVGGLKVLLAYTSKSREALRELGATGRGATAIIALLESVERDGATRLVQAISSASLRVPRNPPAVAEMEEALEDWLAPCLRR